MLAAMEAEYEHEIAQTLHQGRVEAAGLRAAAAAEAQAVRERERRAGLASLAPERARRLNQARRDALVAGGQARETLFAEALAQARERLTTLRDAAGYPAMLHALAREALAQVDGPVILRADPRDARLLHILVVDGQIVFDLDTWGGVEVHAVDGRISVVNTLESRLTQGHELFRQVVMPLFDQQDERWEAMSTPTPAFGR
jgi:vacuolar-type H+-ATPase subunit E/Vma4